MRRKHYKVYLIYTDSDRRCNFGEFPRKDEVWGCRTKMSLCQLKISENSRCWWVIFTSWGKSHIHRAWLSFACQHLPCTFDKSGSQICTSSLRFLVLLHIWSSGKENRQKKIEEKLSFKTFMERIENKSEFSFQNFFSVIQWSMN